MCRMVQRSWGNLEAAIVFGLAAGYRALRLDTLPSMATAHELCLEPGFREVAPYRYNPVARTTFMKLVLDGATDARREPTNR